MDECDKSLEEAKTLLSNPNFKKLPENQMQAIFKVCMAKGITKEDIKRMLFVSEMNRPEVFRKLKARFDALSSTDILVEDENSPTMPSTFYDLLYSTDGLLFKSLPRGKESDEFGELIRILGTIKYQIGVILRSPPNFVAKNDEEKRTREIQVEQYLNEIEMSLTFYADILKISPKDLLNYMTPLIDPLTKQYPLSGRNMDYIESSLLQLNQNFSRFLKTATKNYKDHDLKHFIASTWEGKMLSLEKSLDDRGKEDEETDDIIRDNMELSSEEIDFLIALHHAILDGKIPVLAPFSERSIMQFN